MIAVASAGMPQRKGALLTVISLASLNITLAASFFRRINIYISLFGQEQSLVQRVYCFSFINDEPIISSLLGPLMTSFKLVTVDDNC